MAAPSSSMAMVDFIPQSGTMNLATAPNVVFHYFLYFSSPFAYFAKGLEIRLSLSPATLFSDASLPNHTKMFELVHLVTSVDDFGCEEPGVLVVLQHLMRDLFFPYNVTNTY
jgi:hypothetical protein